MRFTGFQFVEVAVNLIQLLGVGGMGVKPSGCRGDLLERIFVQCVLTHRTRIANGDGVNGDALVFRDLGRLQGRHLAGGVVAVGERDEHAFLGLAAIKQIDGQANGVAECRLRPGHAHLRLVHELAADFQILGERHLHERSAAKENQRHAIALALRQKGIQHFLHGGETVHRLATGILKVLGRHRAGQVHGQNQITHGYFLGDRRFDDLGTRQSKHCADPAKAHR